MRSRVDVPVLLCAAAAGGGVRPVAVANRSGLFYPTRFADDLPRIEEMLAQIEPGFDLAEPFVRVREAMTEARKMGVTGRAA